MQSLFSNGKVPVIGDRRAKERSSIETLYEAALREYAFGVQSGSVLGFG